MKNLVFHSISFFILLLSCEKDAVDSRKVQNSDIPLIVSEMYEEDLGWRYTYNKWNLPDEVRTKWSYQKFYYDGENRITRYDMYEDQGIYSSNWETADAALHRTTWVSPENSLKSLVVKYEYTDDALSQKVYMPQSLDVSRYYIYGYSTDKTGWITRETSDDGYAEYVYDEAGNMKERRQYFNGKLITLKKYTYDDHPNPFIVFKCTAIPGRYTNANNILTETQITYDNEGAVETELTETYSYQYNPAGYPVKRNDGVIYEYR
ncbi:MAG TPA: hypothetical protein VK179_06885 [Bacteroidales bacterium]|nr:hypothetical protein [Bacteroidales bacterium]